MIDLATNGRHPGDVADVIARPLPTAARERWQPLRAGLLNLYRYDEQEFHFEQGRMLLRGNNGTGKSRVLALMLPFLLDAETAPHRLEPDGDIAKRIEWNLLLGKYAERMGYTWLEFGRYDASSATEHYVTIGCGLSAVEDRGLTARWFFITPQRIGRDLALRTPTGHALSRERLVEAIGDAGGTVYTNATEYRAVLDRRFFQLGDRRYGALMNVLVQLRQPQLSRQLDEKRLSAALSEALRPLSSTVIADVAESFRSLEADRATLETFETAVRATESFLAEYQRYAAVAGRRRAERVRGTQAAYEATMRRLRAAEHEHASAVEAVETRRARGAELAVAERGAAQAVETLASSPQMESARALDAARRSADERQADAVRAAQDLADARSGLAVREQEHVTAAATTTAAQVTVISDAREAHECASRVGVLREHEATVLPLGLPDRVVPDLADAAIVSATRRADETVRRRQQAVQHVSELARAVSTSADRLTRAQEMQTTLEGHLGDAVDAQRVASDARESAAHALGQAYHAWVHSLRELQPTAPDLLTNAMAEWCLEANGISPVAVAVREAKDEASSRLAASYAAADHRVHSADEILTELHGRALALQTGRHEPPPAPHTRGKDVRVGSLGAPLWYLCDFAADVSAEHRAGIEAALEAAGLLDAWVTPDGHLIDAQAHDVVLTVLPDMPNAAGSEQDSPQSLNALLVPVVAEGDALVPAAVIRAVLWQIGVGVDAGEVWVDTSGRWRVGPLTGTWSKPAAQHVGTAAREADRRHRLAALEIEIAQAATALDVAHAERATIGDRQTRAQAESRTAPDDGDVRRAVAQLDAAVRAVSAARAKVVESEALVVTRRQELTSAETARDTAAQDLGLTAWVHDLPGLVAALSAYRQALAALWPTMRALAVAQRHLREATDRLAQSTADTSTRAGWAQETEARARAAEVERDTLSASVGTAVEDVLARLADARITAERVRTERDELARQLTDAQVDAARAAEAIEAHRHTLERDTVERDTAMTELGAFAATRLLGVASAALSDIVSEEWSVARGLEVARRIDTALSAIVSDDAAWDRTQRDIHSHAQTLTAALGPYGYDPVMTMGGGVLVVTVPFQGRACTVAELRAALRDEIASRSALLSAREREVLENHLVGEVAMHLHDLLHEAERWIQNMNAELRDRPMSTGMTLRFAWEPAADAPPDFGDVRRRLQRAGGTWSPDERETVGAFLQRQIQRSRAASETGTWQEHLATALDYRAWHVFSVERLQDGHWKRLTRRTHGTGSGGEKAIALTMPQFAAAAAHYRSAGPHAPRLILLDEAFVGIDADMRAKCMGLLAAFDLDFVMTSEREWGCYAALPGVAIYQLATRPGIDAVGVTRWVWNGQQREMDTR